MCYHELVILTEAKYLDKKSLAKKIADGCCCQQMKNVIPYVVKSTTKTRLNYKLPLKSELTNLSTQG